MCAGACVWSRIGAVVYGVSQEDIAAYGRKHGTEDTSGELVSSPADSSSRKAITPFPSPAVFSGKNAKNCSVTALRIGNWRKLDFPPLRWSIPTRSLPQCTLRKRPRLLPSEISNRHNV